MGRVILHVDMDAFYASIEQRDRPELKGKPVVVGGPPNSRGVVCAASYEARVFGVRSAMPAMKAAKLCPSAEFIPPRINVYREESDKIFQILARTGAAIEPMSIDEAYLQLGCERLEDALPTAKQVKSDIFSQRGLTATVGIASNKFLAKLASDIKKPDGLTLIPEERKIAILRPMKVRVIHGVGPVTEGVLNRGGIYTIGDLQDFKGDLTGLVGNFGPELRALSFGEDDRPLELGDVVKSISSEETFDRDTADRHFLRDCLRNEADDVARRLKERGLSARTVQVKVRYADFTTLTRQISTQDSLSEAEEIFRLGCWLLARDKLVNKPLRLLGLGVSGLDPNAPKQLRLI